MGQESAGAPSPSSSYNVDLTREVLLEKDGVEVLATRDRLGAFVAIDPEAGSMLSPEAVLEVLKQAQVVVGVREAKVREMFAASRFGSEQLVAWGHPPKLGENGRLEYLVSLDSSARPSVADAQKLERIDFRNQGHIISVKKDTLLVRRIPAVPGTPGQDVHGSAIQPPAVKEAKLPKGKNTHTDEAGLCLYASIDGQVCKTGDLLTVSPAMDVRGDVDYSVGNLDFHGSLNISGNILVDFVVKAQDDIVIGGVVEGALVAAGGDITIRHGVQGSGKAKLQAGRHFTANFLSQATVLAEEVTINGPILQSRVVANGTLTTTGSKGTIAGGRVSARYLIDCTSAGSELGVRTDLDVGLGPEVREKLHHLHQEIKKVQGQIDRFAPAIVQLQKVREESGEAFPEEHAKALASALSTDEIWRKRLAALEKQRDEAHAEDERHRKAEVLVRGEVYPGVHIRIYDAVLAVSDALKFVRFVRGTDGSISALPLT